MQSDKSASFQLKIIATEKANSNDAETTDNEKSIKKSHFHVPKTSNYSRRKNEELIDDAKQGYNGKTEESQHDETIVFDESKRRLISEIDADIASDAPTRFVHEREKRHDVRHINPFADDFEIKADSTQTAILTEIQQLEQLDANRGLLQPDKESIESLSQF